MTDFEIQELPMNFGTIYQTLKDTLVGKGLSDADAAARATTLFVAGAAIFRDSVTAEARKASPPNLHACVQKAQGDLLAWARAVNP